MTRWIAFYAPLKPPDHVNPSGDRAMARALLAALEGSGLGTPRVAATLRSREPEGDPAAQARLIEAAESEIARIVQTAEAGARPALWLTYHNYYKAPDLIGPGVARALSVPYAQIESTRARKRLGGPWDGFAKAAEAAADAASVIFALTERDRQALEAYAPPGQRVLRLSPFLNRTLAPASAPRRPAGDGPVRLLAVGMMRPGDKLASYSALAAALALASCDWRLEIVGDGAARADVERLFAPYGARIAYAGRLEPEAVAARCRAADLLVWPGVNEAFGLSYLEAQAEGAAVLAEDRPGVRDVVRDGGLLTPPEDPQAFAAALDALAGDRDRLAALGEAGRRQIAAEHDLAAARRTLAEGLSPLIESGTS